MSLSTPSLFSTIQVRPLTMRIGAEIGGVDLREPLPPAQLAEVQAALAQYSVIFFRDQALDFASQQAFGRQFGELVTHSGVPSVPGEPYVVAIHSDADSKYVAGENWHSDLTCNDAPPMGSILWLHTVPEVGGDTLFASMYDAYDSLSSRMKAYLEGLTAVHDGEHVYRPLTDDPAKRFPCHSHPIVRTHPVTGRRALFVNASYTTQIDGVSKDESDAVLGFLYKHCMNPNFQVRFRWRPNSVAFWDNRCTQHLAVWDYYPQRRSGYRVTLKGERPA